MRRPISRLSSIDIFVAMAIANCRRRRRNSVSRYLISERPSARGEPAIPRRTDAEMENSLGRLRLLLTAGVVLALLPVSVAEAGGMYECEFFGLCDGKERKQ